MEFKDFFKNEFEGNIVTIFGEVRSLKTSFILFLLKTGLIKKPFIVDTEGSLAKKGLPVKFALSFKDLMKMLQTVEDCDAIIIDSVGALALMYFSLASQQDTQLTQSAAAKTTHKRGSQYAARNVAIKIQAVYSLLHRHLLSGKIKTAIVVNHPLSKLREERREDPDEFLGDKASFLSKTQLKFSLIKGVETNHGLSITQSIVKVIRSDNIPSYTNVFKIMRINDDIKIKMLI